MAAKVLTKADDPRIPEGIEVPTLKSGRVSYRSWYLPLQYEDLTIRQGLEFLSIVAAPQGQIPEVIRWTEGKDSHLVRQFFYGGVDLQAHDCVHLLLGRGLLTKDEAFVIGFTMGSTNKLETLNKEIFAYIASEYYPNAYKMDAEARKIFMDAARLGHIYKCTPLDEIQFAPHLDQKIGYIRKEINLPVSPLLAYYRDIEKRRHTDDPATARLQTDGFELNAWAFAGEDGGRLLSESASMAEARLNSSDLHYDCRVSQIDHIRDRFLKSHREYLQNQHEISRMCFDEIRKVCGEDHPSVQRDQAEKPWDRYFEAALRNLDLVAAKVLCLDNRSQWEMAGPGLETRSFVHALLNCGDSPTERAFCRGFYDGSADDKSTYAANLKLDVLSEVGLSLDGPYDEAMRKAYHDGIHLAYISDVRPLMDVDLSSLSDHSLVTARQAINLTTSILEAYFNEIAGSNFN